MADKRKYRDTDFLYASSFIRSVEERGLSRSVVVRMLEAPDAELALSYLFEARSALEGGAGIDDDETLIDEFVNDSFRTITEITNDPSVFDFMRYQYDCNNIKTTLKCRAKGVGIDGLLFSCGTVPAEAYAKLLEEGDFSVLPSEFASAAKAADEAYKKTGDPQSIDLPLDLACLEAMTSGAEATGDELLSGAVKLRVDMANVMTALRVIRMNSGTRAELLDRALSPLGNIKKETLIESSAEGEDEFIDAVKGKLPVSFAKKLSAEMSLSAIECAADDAYLEYVSAAKGTVFGINVPFLYLTEREYNAKNCRIILAGKRAVLPYDEIRGRVRGI